MIFNVFCCEAARSGNRKVVPMPAAMLVAPVILIKSLRDTPLPFFFSSIRLSSQLEQSAELICALLSLLPAQTAAVRDRLSYTTVQALASTGDKPLLALFSDNGTAVLKGNPRSGWLLVL